MKLMFLIVSFSCMSQPNFPPKDILQVSQLVQDFVKSADERNVTKMEKILHPNYRTIVNQAFGSTEIKLMDKAAYLDLMKKGVIGGDERTVTILSIDMEDKNAVVKAKFTGQKLVFTTFLQMVKDHNGDWKIMSDLPVIDKIEE